MAKKTICLQAASHREGAEGRPGDEITVDAALADELIASGGAVEVEAKAKPVKATKKPVKKTDDE